MEGDSIAGAPLLPPMGKRARFMLNRALYCFYFLISPLAAAVR